MELHNLLTPCNMIFIGSTMCGKTTLLKTLLFTQLMDDHDMTIVLSPTSKVSQDFEVFKEVKTFQIREKNLDKRLEEILDNQSTIVETKSQDEAAKILVILDDCLGSKFLQFGGKFDMFSTKSRHYKITFIILTQSLRRVPHTFRMQTRYIFAFSSSNFKALEAMLEEFCPKKYIREFNKKLPEIYDVPYSFVFCQCFETRPKLRLWAVNPDLSYKNIITDILEKD